jgi:hypothetical protein
MKNKQKEWHPAKKPLDFNICFHVLESKDDKKFCSG